MIWLAFDLSMALGGYILLALLRWILDILETRSNHTQTDPSPTSPHQP